jgi:hypothetical protein
VRRQQQPDGVVLHRRRHDHLVAHQPRPPLDLAGVHHLVGPRQLAPRRPVEDRGQLLAGRERHQQLEEEPVELGLGQRVGPFLLDRVLRRQHEERLLELVDGPGHRDAVLLHRLQQCGLRLGRGAVDLVGQDDLREDRAGLEAEVAAAVGRLGDDVRAGDVRGHQVGGELDAVERQVEGLGEGADQERLAQPGDALEQDVAADEQGGEHAADDLRLADDDLADLGLQRGEPGAELFGAGRQRGVGGVHARVVTAPAAGVEGPTSPSGRPGTRRRSSS